MANSKSRILHIFPDSSAKRYSHSGGSKGIKIFDNFIDLNQLQKTNLVIKKKSDIYLLKELTKCNLSNYSHVLIHYPMFPLSVIYLKLKNRKLNIIIRSHNAEFPHWLQHAYLEFKALRFKRSIICFLTSIRNGFGEIMVGIFANHILAITEWEQKNYWQKRVLNKSKILYVPYFIYRNEKVIIKKDKKNMCLCLMAPNHSAFLDDAAKNFCSIVSSLTDHEHWEFALTGDGYKISDNCSSVKQLGFVENIQDLLNKTSAIALLTEYGYGFKTKILEAAAADCWSIVPINVMSSIPLSIKPFCIPVNTACNRSFLNALRQSENPLPNFEDQNNELKSYFTQNMNNILNIEEVI